MAREVVEEDMCNTVAVAYVSGSVCVRVQVSGLYASQHDVTCSKAACCYTDAVQQATSAVVSYWPNGAPSRAVMCVFL